MKLASLLFLAFIRVLTGVATRHCASAAKTSAAVCVCCASRSSRARIAGIRCLARPDGYIGFHARDGLCLRTGDAAANNCVFEQPQPRF
jgi:hypothetical protein